MVFFNAVCRLCTSAEVHIALQDNSIALLKAHKKAILSILDLLRMDMGMFLGDTDEMMALIWPSSHKFYYNNG